jgi:hypothetical protein
MSLAVELLTALRAIGAGIGAFADDAVAGAARVLVHRGLGETLHKAFRADAGSAFLVDQTLKRGRLLVLILAMACVSGFCEIPANKPELSGANSSSQGETNKNASDQAGEKAIAPVLQYNFDEICHSFFLGMVLGLPIGVLFALAFMAIVKSIAFAWEVKDRQNDKEELR